METDIITDEDRLKKYLSFVEQNTKDLLKQKYPNQRLVQEAIPRGLKMVRGNIDKQTVIDLCSIALTVLMQLDNV